MNNNSYTFYNELLESFFHEYSTNQLPIKINIRSITSTLESKRKILHNIHKYPAKLLYGIPFFLLNNSILSKNSDIVLDPFCGSGTTLLEANLSNKNAIGIDSNPIACLISEVKSKSFELDIIEEYEQNFLDVLSDLKVVESKIPLNLEPWFSKHIYSQLLSIYSSILTIQNSEYKKFFLLCFSQVLGKVSFADPRIYVPVKLRIEKYANDKTKQKVKKRLESLENIAVIDVFMKVMNENKKIYQNNDLRNLKKYWSKVINYDVRKSSNEINQEINKISPHTNKVDLIITSPPYAGAQKYIRSSRISLLWFGYTSIEINALEKNTIGRETISRNDISQIGKTNIHAVDDIIVKIAKINPERAAIIYYYIKDIENSLESMVKLLKKGKYLVLIIGNNTVCGMKFENHLFFEEILAKHGMSLKLVLVDNIQAFGMMTKRNQTSNIIREEYIMIYRKD